MNTETNSIKEKNEGKKESFVWMQIVSFALLLFSISLSSPDPATRLITGVCLFTSAFLSYLSTRKKLNVIGIILLIISVFFLIQLTLVTLKA